MFEGYGSVKLLKSRVKISVWLTPGDPNQSAMPLIVRAAGRPGGPADPGYRW